MFQPEINILVPNKKHQRDTSYYNKYLLDIKKQSHYISHRSSEKISYKRCVKFLVTVIAFVLVNRGVKYEKIRQQTSTNDYVYCNYDTNRMRYSTGVSKGI
jgi:surface polysaccharide O-acyltransferase-like enzyme